VLGELAPLAYEAGLGPREFRESTVAEVTAYIHAAMRRWARAHDARAWAVAHLMLATGNLRRGLTVGTLMRELLGREPGTVAPPTDRTMSPEATAAHLKAWVDTMQATPSPTRVRES
jgi:hypothetical protein